MGRERCRWWVGASYILAGIPGVQNKFSPTVVSWKFVCCPVVWRKVKTVIGFRSNPEETAPSSVLHQAGTAAAQGSQSGALQRY